jgi:hypothetical protein
VGEFAALISTDAAAADAKFGHESPDYVQWRFFGLCEEDPQASRRAINDDEVSAIAFI